jgi:DNA-binding XRE family transcriptional regulator
MEFTFMSKRSEKMPIPVKRALIKLGGDIRNARRRRRIQIRMLAERASITRATLHKIEKGDPGVAMGIYATVLFVLGMLDRLAEMADPVHDQIGLALEEEMLPQRIRYSKGGGNRLGDRP